MADEGVNYFPLYCTLDEKFELLEAEYGLKGFAIVVKLFQRIYKEHGYYCEWNNDISLIFAKQCGFSNVGESGKNNRDFLGGADGSSPSGKSKNLIDHVIAASLRRGIFDKDIFNNYSILTSRGIQRNFLRIVRNRKNVEIKKEYLLLSDAEIKGNVVIIDDSYVRNVDSYVRMGQSKVKESKEKKKEIPRASRFEDFWSAYPNQQRRHLAEKAYCDLILSGIVQEEDLILAAQNYAAHVKDSGDKMFLPNNFLEKCVFEDYLQVTEPAILEAVEAPPEPEEEPELDAEQFAAEGWIDPNAMSDEEFEEYLKRVTGNDV